MHLPVIKPMTYISPSSFQTYMMCPNKTYLTRLADHQFIKTKSTKPAAIGSAYGAFLADFLAQRKGIDSPHLNLQRMLNRIEVEPGVSRTNCINMARELASQYTKLPFVERFLDASELLIEVPRYRLLGGVPIYGIPDVVADGIPYDFKCRPLANGPTPGYKRRYTLGGVEQPGYHTPMTIDEANEAWAIQMTFYTWLCNVGPENVQYGIHELGGGTVVEHIGKIPGSFKESVKQGVFDMWENVNMLNAEIKEPVPSKMVCEKWNQICEAAPHCAAYMTSLGDPAMRETM